VKFLVDAQLPKSLSDLLKQRGHDSVHTLELPNQNKTSDKTIIELSIDQERIVITKDNDFLESFLLNSEPRKLIIVRTGNIPNKVLLQLFDDNLQFMELLLSRSNLIEITQSEIAEHG
jgi:predicted nuclease of predicted toxin-antitoxin system